MLRGERTRAGSDEIMTLSALIREFIRFALPEVELKLLNEAQPVEQALEPLQGA